MAEFSTKSNTDKKSTELYEISDLDILNDPSYYGYINKDGKWYIKQIDENNGTIRFTSGNNNYSTNWTNKINLIYNRYDETF